jgi:hypothetical protein
MAKAKVRVKWQAKPYTHGKKWFGNIKIGGINIGTHCSIYWIKPEFAHEYDAKTKGKFQVEAFEKIALSTSLTTAKKKAIQLIKRSQKKWFQF